MFRYFIRTVVSAAMILPGAAFALSQTLTFYTY